MDDTVTRLRQVLLDDSTRSRVGKLLHRTVGKIGASHRLLGLHLDRSIRTGYACTYDDRHRVAWTLSPPGA